MSNSSKRQIYDHNSKVWNTRVRKRLLHTRMATDRDFQAPLEVLDPHGWLVAGVAGKHVLCLAAGGGLQSVLLAAAGAVVTVVDLSVAMLDQDRRAAVKQGVQVRIVEGSMDDLSMLGNTCFDLVIQPVSTCYVPDIIIVYQEVARVIRPGGLYLSQHKQPANLQASAVPGPRGYALPHAYYRKEPLPPVPGDYEHREAGAIEFLHRWEDLLGGLCRSGFVIEDVREPNYANPIAPPGTFRHRSHFIPPYVAIKARRIAPSTGCILQNM